MSSPGRKAACRYLGAEPERIVVDGVTPLRWTFGAPRVLLLGHHDTVWPMGSLDTRPWSGTDGIARGPGVFDVKAGLVQMFHALAAHSGLEPEKGVKAAIEAAHLTLSLDKVAMDINAGTSGNWCTTVTPTVVTAGSVTNTVPARATVSVDVRVPTLAAQAQVDAALHALRTTVPGARLEIRGGPNRPPLEETSSAGLFRGAAALAQRHGLQPLASASVGGASDGNFTAGLGCPTLDGLGAVGGGTHADHEHVIVAEMLPRTRLLAALVAEVLR